MSTSSSAPHAIGSAERPLRVAIVGAGPSGFYAAEALLKSELHVSVDLFDRLPTPYGLVRFGVAPDHQKIKSVIRQYEKLALQNSHNLRFFGNVGLGRDIEVDDLRRHYDQILYTVGCESDRRMQIPGEDLPQSYTATAFVAWFNGHPDYVDAQFDLSHERVAVVGVGNVAMDVTRVLLRDREELAKTDIAEHALEALRRSKVREVVLLGRRGAAQAAFSPKEIREIGELAGVDLIVDPREVELDELSSEQAEADADARRNVEYLTEMARRGSTGAERRAVVRFLSSPTEVIEADGAVCGLRVVKNELYRSADGSIRPRATDESFTLEIGAVFRSIGYSGVPLAGVPFHERWGIIPNQDGRVLDGEGRVVPNEYVAGWIKRGPTGLIGTNKGDAKATVDAMLADIAGKTGVLSAELSPHAVDYLLDERGVRRVSFAEWKILDELEVANGAAKGKVREKFTSLEAMLAALKQARS